MADIEKVIKGLEICRHRAISQENCKECPYIYDGRAKQSNCEGVLHLDALALLKEQKQDVICRDCKHRGYDSCPMEPCCRKPDDWFCGDGERKSY